MITTLYASDGRTLASARVNADGSMHFKLPDLPRPPNENWLQTLLGMLPGRFPVYEAAHFAIGDGAKIEMPRRCCLAPGDALTIWPVED